MTQQDTSALRSFASDNYAGVHPEILEAIAEANVGHAPSYGDDPWTRRFSALAREMFGPHAQAFPVFNGTGANVIALQSILPRWGAVVAPRTAHITTDEGGAPEKTGALKIYEVTTPDGKLTPELAEQQTWGWGNPHRSQPLAISISQVTEFGTCYTPEEVRALADFAHGNGMALHMDGSRLSNAAAHLDLSFREFTADAGVDIVSLGATKNGALGAEAVVVLNPDVARGEAAQGLEYIRKTNMQLGSKMRFISAQLLALYGGDLWLRSARHANEMALLLRDELGDIAPIPFAVQSNVVFVELTSRQKSSARQRFHFYDWPGDPNLVRLMCSFDTVEEDVRLLAEAVRRAGR